MRIAFAVVLLFVAYAASYPAYNEAEADDNLELELRSILNHLNDEQDSDEQMTRSVSSEESSEEDDGNEYAFSKRQGGHNVVDKQTKCEIECVHAQRFPDKGKGKSIKDAAKTCKNVCLVPGKKRGQKGKQPRRNNNKNVREFDDDLSEDNNEDKRREFFDYLMEQMQQNNN